jgi:hypothetical protein
MKRNLSLTTSVSVEARFMSLFIFPADVESLGWGDLRPKSPTRLQKRLITSEFYLEFF